MKKDKAVIISYYRWWDKRQRFFYEFYINQGYEVNYYVSSFNHITKKVDMIDVPEIAEIVVSPRYYSNFSFRRIYSNIIFSIKVIRKLNISKPKVIVVLLPSNILAAFTSIYSKMNNTSLIVDILDLWPESLPVNKKIKVIFSPIFSLWSFLRKIAIKASDLVILECNYYNDILKRDLVKKNSKVLYLQKSNGIDFINKNIDDVLKFVYLGSINHIIDIDLMVELLTKINKKKRVFLDIIGKGEREDYFISLLNQNKIKHRFWGSVFENEKKLLILSQSHFGLNIMKENVAVGLTTKSVEYLESNLPLINTIPFDTEDLIEEYNAGYNIKQISNNDFINSIINLSSNDYNILSKNSKKLFWDKFSTFNFKSNLSEILSESNEDLK